MPLLASKKLKTYLSLSVGATAAGGTALTEAAVLVWNGAPVTVNFNDTARNIKWSVTTMTASTSIATYNPGDSSEFFIQYRSANYIYTANSGTNGLNVTAASGSALTRLGVGDTVGPSSTWRTNIWGYLTRQAGPIRPPSPGRRERTTPRVSSASITHRGVIATTAGHSSPTTTARASRSR